MKNIICLFTAIALFTFVSCKKHNAELPTEQKLTGKWKLESESNGFSGKTEKTDPATVQMLEFKTGNQYEKTVNGQITHQGNYNITQRVSIITHQLSPVLRFDPDPNTIQPELLITFDNEKLSLALNAYDGGGLQYIRVK